MKKRIQYLYEKGGNNAWFQMMLNADNLADLLTRAEYTQQMYEQDRESLQKYARTIEEVQKLEEQYEQEKADFETMKEEYEAQQSNLQYQLDVTRANSADCENEIAYAQQQATEYANLLEQQQAEIEQLEAERIAAEEEARRQAEAEAAAAAAAQEAAQNGDNSSEEVQYDEDGNVVSGSSDGSSDYEYDEYGNVIDTDNTVDYNSDATAPTVPQIVLLTVHQPAVLQVPALLLYPMQHSLLETHMYGEEQVLPVVLTAPASCRVYMQTLA